MKPIFVDTSALIALGNKNDAFHQQKDKKSRHGKIRSA